MRLRLATLAFAVLFGAAFSLRVSAQSTTLTFSMPQGVDPPVVKFLNTGSVVTNGSELDPTVGVELHGRALQVASNSGTCQLIYRDITALQIQFVYAGNVKVKTLVATGFAYTAWNAQASVDKTTNTWTILLTAQAGSAPLSDWNLTGVTAQGLFGALTASQGNGPAPISNVTITPVATVLNPNQKPAADVVDTTPPSISAAVNPTTIWSPNGQLVPVTLTATLQDVTQDLHDYLSGVDPCSVSVDVVQVDGTTSTDLGPQPFTLVANPDGSYSLTAQLLLSATRNGFNAAGRIYYITVYGTDNVGNPSQATVTVTVTHDQSG